MAFQEADQETEQGTGLPRTSVLEAIAGSTSLKVSIVGVLMWILAAVLQAIVRGAAPQPGIGSPSTLGVWAALLAIWGTALIVVGVAIYSIVWWTYQ